MTLLGNYSSFQSTAWIALYICVGNSFYIPKRRTRNVDLFRGTLNHNQQMTSSDVLGYCPRILQCTAADARNYSLPFCSPQCQIFHYVIVYLRNVIGNNNTSWSASCLHSNLVVPSSIALVMKQFNTNDLFIRSHITGFERANKVCVNIQCQN